MMNETMLSEGELERSYLGQFIPVHYHHNMLMAQKPDVGLQGGDQSLGHTWCEGA